VDEDHVPRLLQEHQHELRLEMHSLVALERRTNIEEEALTAKTMMTSMRTTPYLLDPVLCCSSFSPSCGPNALWNERLQHGWEANV
jgi:hypothetical protein